MSVELKVGDRVRIVDSDAAAMWFVPEHLCVKGYVGTIIAVSLNPWVQLDKAHCPFYFPAKSLAKVRQ